MRIESIEISNFRGFYGSHSIDFSTGDDSSTTLIIGENGVGKSSILNSIFWCFYDELTQNTHKKNLVIHQEANNCQVSIKISDNTDNVKRVYQIQRKKNNSADSILSAFEINEVGAATPHRNPLQLINSYLPKPLANYFLFYGESLTKVAIDADTLKNAIEDFQGLTAATAAAKNIDDALQELMRKSSGAAKKSGQHKIAQSNYDNACKQVTESINLQEKFKKNAKKEDDKAKKISDILGKSNIIKLQALEEKRIDEINNRTRVVGSIKGFKDDRKKALNEYAIDTFSYKFSKDINNWMTESAQGSGIPGKYHEATILTLLKTGTCLCGENLVKGDSHYTKVEEKLRDADTEELAAKAQLIPNAIAHTDSRNISFADLIEKIENKLADSMTELGTLNKSIETIENKRDELSKTNEGKSLDLTQLLDDQKGHETKRDDHLIKAGSYSQAQAQAEKDKKTTQAALRKYLQTSGPNNSLASNIFFLEEASKEIQSLIASETKLGKDWIFDDMNKSLKNLSSGNHEFRFHKDTYLPDVIKTDGKELILSDGEMLLKQNLFFATALIKHSKRRSGAQSDRFIPGTIAPIVADAPFGFLDGENNEIAASLLLESADQLIMMLNSKSFSGGVEEVLLKGKKKIGKVYIIKKFYTGEAGNKNLKPVTIFGKTFDTASYGNKIETSKIEPIKI